MPTVFHALSVSTHTTLQEKNWAFVNEDTRDESCSANVQRATRDFTEKTPTGKHVETGRVAGQHLGAKPLREVCKIIRTRSAGQRLS